MKTGLQFLVVNAVFLLALFAEGLANRIAETAAFKAFCSAIAGGAISLVEYLAR